MSAATAWRRGHAITSDAASARIGVISGAMIIAPMTTAVESPTSPSEAMITERTISVA